MRNNFFIMAIRVNRLLREANIGMQTLNELLKALDYNETIEVTSKILCQNHWQN